MGELSVPEIGLTELIWRIARRCLSSAPSGMLLPQYAGQIRQCFALFEFRENVSFLQLFVIIFHKPCTSEAAL
jgi:hypothetical protein